MSKSQQAKVMDARSLDYEKRTSGVRFSFWARENPGDLSIDFEHRNELLITKKKMIEREGIRGLKK